MAIYADDKYIQDIITTKHPENMPEISPIWTKKKPTILGRHFLVGVAGFEPAQA